MKKIQPHAEVRPDEASSLTVVDPVPLAATPEFNDQQAARNLLAHTKHVDEHRFLLGLHCYWIKAQISKGEFGPWLQKFAPELCRLRNGETPQPKRNLDEAMRFCREAAEKAGFGIGKLLENLGNLHFPTNVGKSHGGEILLLNDADLPAEAKPLKEQLLKGIQLQLDFENGEKKEASPKGAHKTLTPTQALEAEIKNTRALAENCEAGLEGFVQIVSKKLDHIEAVQLIAISGLCDQVKKIIAAASVAGKRK